MKILIISTRMNPYTGGVEVVLDKLFDNLGKKHEISAVTTFELDKISESQRTNRIYNVLRKIRFGFVFQLPIEKYKGVDVKRIWINKPTSVLAYLSFPYRFIFSTYSLIRYIKQTKPEVINYHFPDDSCIYIYTAMLFVKTPLVVNIHGNDLHVFSKKFIYSSVIYRLLEKSKKVIINSIYMKEELEKFYRNTDKMKIIPNGIDTSEFKKINPSKYFVEDYIFFVGRLVQKKGVDLLIRAFSKANLGDMKMLIEGYAEEYESLVKLTSHLGLNNRIKFTKGSLSNVEKIKYMKGAKFGVIPSRIEPFGIVALEFMAAGVPLVASETGGLKSFIIDNENALFFKNGDVNDLVSRLELMNKSTDLRKRLSQNALNTVEKYDNSEIANRYIEVYDEVAD